MTTLALTILDKTGNLKASRMIRAASWTLADVLEGEDR